MLDVFTDDLAVFFTDFAVTATIGGAAKSVLWDQEWEAVQFDLGTIDASKSAILARSADVAAVAIGDSVTISAVVYKVSGVQPDGTGVTRLLLMRY